MPLGYVSYDMMCKRGIKQRTDLSLAARSTVLSGDLEETVGVDLKGGEELRLATGHRRNVRQLEFTEQTVVAALGTFTLVAKANHVRRIRDPTKLSSLHRESDSGLVVLDRSEYSRFVGGDRSIPGNDDTENVALHGDTERQRSNIQQEQVSSLVRSLASEDSSLDGSTVGNCLIGVDRLVRLTATEILRHERLDLGDTGGSTDQDDLIDLLTGHLSILEYPLDGVESRLEQGRVDLLETSTSNVGREVLTLPS